MSREMLAKARRVVVKAGTRTLLDDAQKPDLETIRRLLEEMLALKADGRAVTFVTSAAIGTGLAPLGFPRRPEPIPQLQAAAAVGQSILMEVYNRILAPHGYAVAQLLLTHGDFQDRRRYLNVRNMLRELEERAVLPVINENDTVAVDEIRFGDNDYLAGLVANAIDAEVTILLSDVDGFYVEGRLQEEVGEVTPQMEAAAGGTRGLGSGGMASKIRAARTVTAAGGCLVLAHGKEHSLGDILQGRPQGTLFRPQGTRLDHRKRWIAHTLKAVGDVVVDAGGVEALCRKGRSLLPVGVTGCDGDFDVGDPVSIRNGDGSVVAKGLVNYSASDVRRIMGRRTEEIEGLLGFRSSDELVHRDNLVILE